MYRLEKIPPLIGATVTGPLGVMHLPRMWLKGVLSAAGSLWDGYFDDDKGFNHQVVEGLGLEPIGWFAFLKTLPTYPQAEEYVKAHATKLDPASIAKLNANVAGYLRQEENAKVTRARVGIDDASVTNSAMLLNFDDWFTIHEVLTAHRADGLEPLTPMVSSAETGLLGIPHLPRLWMKALLSNVGALPKDWKTGPECGFDQACATKIGMDLVAACAFIKSELPDDISSSSSGWRKTSRCPTPQPRPSGSPRSAR